MTDDFEGFREFFEARGQALSRTAFFLTGSDEAAQDVLQGALVKVLARWRSVTSRGSPEAYIRKVMLNEVRSRWRRRPMMSVGVPEMFGEANHGDDFQDRIVDKEILRQALQILTPRQRMVLYLRYYEDLSERQTAEHMRCSVGTVKSQTHDALNRLRTVAPACSIIAHRSEVKE